MTKKNKRILIYVIFGWLLFAYPFYVMAEFLWIFLGPIVSILVSILLIFVASGVFIGGAEKSLRTEKIDALLDKKLGE